jgi:hypothetical protein
LKFSPFLHGSTNKEKTMIYFRRFGRRMPVPSTLQISHELRAFSAQDDARIRCAAEEGLPSTASWEEIIVRRRVDA